MQARRPAAAAACRARPHCHTNRSRPRLASSGPAAATSAMAESATTVSSALTHLSSSAPENPGLRICAACTLPCVAAVRIQLPCSCSDVGRLSERGLTLSVRDCLYAASGTSWYNMLQVSVEFPKYVPLSGGACCARVDLIAGLVAVMRMPLFAAHIAGML